MRRPYNRNNIIYSAYNSMSGHDLNLQQVQKKFAEAFPYSSANGGSSSTNATPRYFFAPGRVNLMGDHIDYCGGKVLPATISAGTYVAARIVPALMESAEMDEGMDDPENSSPTCNYSHPLSVVMHSANKQASKQGGVRAALDDITYDPKHGWANYPKGVLLEYQKLGIKLREMELLYWGNMPIGSSLSSSSSILLATAMAVQSMHNFRHEEDDNANRIATALLCHRSEVSFNKVNCGTMDQGAVALGRKDRVMLLNCQTLECDYITPHWGDYKLLIVNSGKPRNLTETAYNQRRAESSECLSLVKDKFKVNNLCDIPTDKHSQVLDIVRRNGNETLHKRARHILSETQRVNDAVAALTTGDMSSFAELLNQSHSSLRYDYEVSGYELDILVDESVKHPAVLGARMTGGGFTGCILALVAKDGIDEYVEQIKKMYKEKTSLEATILDATPCDGARELKPI